MYESLSVAAFELQGELVATEALWSAKPKVFMVWPFTDKACQPLL